MASVLVGCNHGTSSGHTDFPDLDLDGTELDDWITDDEMATYVLDQDFIAASLGPTPRWCR